MPYIGKSPGKLGVRTKYHYTATGSETSKSGSDDNGLTLKFDDGEYVDVFLNGILLVAGSDYNTNTANTISGLAALAANDVIEVVVYDIFSLAKINSEAQRTKYYKTASGGETSITGNDDGGTAITFPAGAQIDVRLNGVSLKQGDDYNTNTANTVGGLTALTAGQLVEIVVYEKFVLADMVKKSGDTMTGGLSAPSITSTGSATITGDLTVDTNTMFVDSTNNEVGIGTTTPATFTDYVSGGNAPSVVVAGSQPSYVLADTDVSGSGSTLGITKSGDSTIINNLGGGNIDFYNNGGHRMRIDSSGRVTKPDQVCFVATGNNGNYVNTSPIPFPSVVTNIGNAYNSSNYTFTAPIAGRYFFHLHIGVTQGHNNGTVYPWFTVNGSNVMYTYHQVNASTMHSHTHITSIFSLGANDTVKVTFNGTGQYYNNAAESRFMGYLLG